MVGDSFSLYYKYLSTPYVSAQLAIFRCTILPWVPSVPPCTCSVFTCYSCMPVKHCSCLHVILSSHTWHYLWFQVVKLTLQFRCDAVLACSCFGMMWSWHVHVSVWCGLGMFMFRYDVVLVCSCFQDPIYCALWSAMFVVGVCGVVCVGTRGQFICVLFCYLVFITCHYLCVSMLVSFIRRLSLLISYMWYFSSVFRCFLFYLSSWTASVV
jgi:hypothetical protein